VPDGPPWPYSRRGRRQGKGPFLLGSGATVEVAGGHSPVFGQVAHAVQAWLVKIVAARDAPRPGPGMTVHRFQAVEIVVLAPAGLAQAEEFIVAPDLRLESRLGTSSHPRSAASRPGPARPAGFRGQPPREDSPESGRPEERRCRPRTRAKVPSPLCSTRRLSWDLGGHPSVHLHLVLAGQLAPEKRNRAEKPPPHSHIVHH